MGQWFLDRELRQDFCLLDMNGIRAAYRAVRIPPPVCPGGSMAVISHETEKQEEVAPERPFVCTACNYSFETLRQLVTHQTHKHGYRNPPGIVTVTNTCVWCQNIYKDRRATYLHHQQSWKRGYCTGNGSHLHTVVIPVKTSCSHCDQHFNSVALLLEHLRTVFPLVRNAELGLNTVVRNDGIEAKKDEASERCAVAAESKHAEANASALKHDLEIRELHAATFRTLRVKLDEPLMLASKVATGLFVTKSKEGQRPPGEPHVYGWAAMTTAMTKDQALSAEDKQTATAYMSSVTSPETLLQSVYWSQFKKTFQKNWIKWQCSVDSQTQPILGILIKDMK